MGITRTSWTDDDGSGTTGTIINNAAKTTLYDELDGRWSEITTTATGTQNNVSITSSSIECDVLRCNNASDLTITGIAKPASPAKPGKKLVVYSVGAGNVFLAHNSGSSSNGNKLLNAATSGNTPLAAGVGIAIYVYDATVTNGAWRLVSHNQGASITPTFADSHYTGAGTDADWALASGDRTTQNYRLVGRRVFMSFYLVTTSVSNTPASLRMTNAAWGGFTAAETKIRLCTYSDNGAANTTGHVGVTGGTDVLITKQAGGNFANATNTTQAFGDLDFEVT